MEGTKMLCPKCQFENPDDAKFCIECASRMEFHCPNCRAITPATGKFCKECGYDLKKPKAKPSPYTIRLSIGGFSFATVKVARKRKKMLNPINRFLLSIVPP